MLLTRCLPSDLRESLTSGLRTGQSMIQRRPPDAEVAANSGLASAVFQRGHYSFHFLRIDSPRATAPPTAFPGRFQACHDPLPCQGPFILRQSTEHAEQERAVWRGRIHLLGQGAKPQGNRISSCPCQYLQQVPCIETAKESFLPDAEGSGALLS